MAKTHPAYGEKRDYPKIDLYIGGKYACSTTWARTLKEAVAHFSIAKLPYSKMGLQGAITARKAD